MLETLDDVDEVDAHLVLDAALALNVVAEDHHELVNGVVLDLQAVGYPLLHLTVKQLGLLLQCIDPPECHRLYHEDLIPDVSLLKRYCCLQLVLKG